MGAHTGRKAMSLYNNGCGELGTNENFTFASWYTADKLSGDGCFAVTYDTTGGFQSSDFIPVDTSKYYYHSVSVRTLQRSGTTNLLSGGHLGFACYDKYKNFIDLRNCGGVGNTYLSRPANPGDTVIYIQSGSSWYTGSDVTNNNGIFRHVLFFPASHPDYGKPHQYTRFNNLRYKGLVSHSNGDWMMTLESPIPNWGYALPAGTPVSRGVAGGTFNYCHGNPNYPETWTTYTTGAFTGENRNSSVPFRYATKYIRFLILANYNIRSDSGRPRPKFLLDNIMLHQAKPPRPAAKRKPTAPPPASYRSIKTDIFKRKRLKWRKKR